MLQIANAFFKLYVPTEACKAVFDGLTAYRPGDYLPHDADEIEGFKLRLNDRLAPTNPKESDTEWEIGDCLAQWSVPRLTAQRTQEALPDPPTSQQGPQRTEEHEIAGGSTV